MAINCVLLSVKENINFLRGNWEMFVGSTVSSCRTHREGIFIKCFTQKPEVNSWIWVSFHRMHITLTGRNACTSVMLIVSAALLHKTVNGTKINNLHCFIKSNLLRDIYWLSLTFCGMFFLKFCLPLEIHSLFTNA